MQMASASFLAITFILVSLLCAAFAALAIAYDTRNAGYTYMERIAADPWDASTVFIAILTTIPPVILLANIALPRRAIAALVHNRVSAAALLAVSLAALLATPALHVYSNFVAYDEFTAALNSHPVPVSELGAAAANYLNIMQTGAAPQGKPLVPGSLRRSESDVGVKNPRNGASLAGGWVTGPGNAKVTLPIATTMCDLAYAMLVFRPQVAATGALDDVREQIVQGAEYLRAAYDEATGAQNETIQFNYNIDSKNECGPAPFPRRAWAMLIWVAREYTSAQMCAKTAWGTCSGTQVLDFHACRLRV